MPQTRLRRIAVYVDEPEPNDFYWVMIESHPDLSAWVEVDSSTTAFLSWIEAHQAGNQDLLKQFQNLRLGPRDTAKNENISRREISARLKKVRE